MQEVTPVSPPHDMSALTHNGSDWYKLSWYNTFENATGVDEIKKYLEYVCAYDLVADRVPCGKSLDVGTATGRYLRAWARLGYNSFGIDISSEAVSIAQKQLADHGLEVDRVQRMDVRSLIFPDNTFRLASCMMGTLAHIRDVKTAVREISRVLEPGGQFVISNWLTSNPDVEFLEANSSAHDEKLRAQTPNPAEIMRSLESVGLVPLKIRYAVLLPTQAVQNLVTSHKGEPGGFLDRVALLERHVRNLFPRRQGQIFIVLAQKAV
jgi:ubiquinone/menaquinone biosynthesis C-methylase UbiE